MAQFGRPDSDIAKGSWSPYPASPTTLWDKLDEETQNGDTDYAVSSTEEDEFEVGLADVTDPTVGTGHYIRCYAKAPGGGGAKERLTISLYENGTQRAASSSTDVDRTAYGLIEHNLSEAEANSISNYANLRIRIHADVIGSGEEIRVTQCELEVPDAAGDLSIDKSDSVSANEYLKELMECMISPSDSVGTSEYLKQLLESETSIQESVNVDEYIKQHIGQILSIQETVNVDEYINRCLECVVLIQESINADEYIAQHIACMPSVQDSVNISEYVEGYILELARYIDVSTLIGESENLKMMVDLNAYAIR